MGLKSLISKIDELKELVEGWQREGEISSVERDLALERVKKIYEQLRFPIEVEPIVKEVKEEVVEEVIEETAEEVIEEAAEEAAEYVAEEEISVIEIDEHIELVSFEPEPKAKPKSKSKSEPRSDLDLELEFDQPIFTDDSARKERRRKILSLYADDCGDVGLSQPQTEYVEEESEPEPSVVEKIEESEEIEITEEIEVPEEIDQRPIAKPSVSFTPQYTPPPTPHRAEVLPSLNDQLGFNDRFLMANDLFQGDFEALGSALKALDRCQTINESLIYIAEHYGWSGNNDGAKLLYSMLKSRYTNRE